MKKEIKYSVLFILITLLTSYAYALFVFANPKNLQFFTFIMLVPATVGIILNFIRYRSFRIVFRPLFHKFNLKSILFAIFYPVAFIILLALILSVTGVANCNQGKLDDLFNINFQVRYIFFFIGSFIFTFGEEYGWRGFLLKDLAEIKGRVFATLVVGVVWALYHAPYIYGLASVAHMDHPFLLMIIQMGAVFVFSIPFAYSYFISNSIVPPILFHIVWNTFNPLVLGNVYRNTQGIMEGNLLYINGEGLAGLVFGLILMVWFINQFNKFPKQFKQETA